MKENICIYLFKSILPSRAIGCCSAIYSQVVQEKLFVMYLEVLFNFEIVSINKQPH